MPLNEVNSKDARIASAYHVGRQWSGASEFGCLAEIVRR